MAAAGDISTVVGGPGQGAATQIAQKPVGVVVSGGALLVSDGQYGVVRSLELSTGNEGTFAGSSCPGFAGDGGPATDAAMRPLRLATAGDGSVYIADGGHNAVWKVDPGGTIHRFAGRADGTGGFGGNGGPADQATLNDPEAVAVDGSGNVYIADFQNHMVRMVDPAGVISTVAGNGNWYTPSPDNVPATQVSLSGPKASPSSHRGRSC